MQTTKPSFRKCAIASGLITQAQLDEAAAQLRDRGIQVDETEVGDRWLADRLVQMELLSEFQATQLASGRTKLSLGPYTIIDWIGQGGMGQVFKAVHTMMGRTVAIKVLPRSRSTPEAIASFTREIRAQALLDHENLVRALDAGHDSDVYFLVCEYVPGADLRRYLRDRGPLGMSEAATIISQAARGLDHAHRNGLIHRDVKPANLLVTPDGRTKLSDLGLVGSIEEQSAEARSRKVVGTADYLSPEQITSPGIVSPASDVYSLGCTLYYAVTGKVPFPGGTMQDKVRRHCEDTPIHPRVLNPSLSVPFVEVIGGMMEKDPAKRIKTAAEVVERLKPWAGETVSSPRDPETLRRLVEQDIESGSEAGELETPPSFPALALRPAASTSWAVAPTSPTSSTQNAGVAGLAKTVSDMDLHVDASLNVARTLRVPEERHTESAYYTAGAPVLDKATGEPFDLGYPIPVAEVISLASSNGFPRSENGSALASRANRTISPAEGLPPVRRPPVLLHPLPGALSSQQQKDWLLPALLFAAGLAAVGLLLTILLDAAGG